jgi:hypothetical protein
MEGYPNKRDVYKHSRPRFRGFLWNLLLYSQGCVLIAAWLMVLIQVQDWASWDLPYQSLWFVIHLVQLIAVNRVDSLCNSDTASLNHIMDEDHHMIALLDLVVICIDAATLIAQVGIVQLNASGTTASKVQLAFVVYVLFVSLLRCANSCRTQELQCTEFGLCTSANARVKPRTKTAGRPKKIT